MQGISASERQRPQPAVAEGVPAHVARVAAAGSAHHRHLLVLTAANGPHGARDLADAIHLLCHLHGARPGVIDMALDGCPAGPARGWLAQTAERFAGERHFLVQLVAAVGPLPSTPGAAEAESALLAQRHAIETLARSERSGCALGAATALAIDWTAIRPLLGRAAARAGLDRPLPDLTAGIEEMVEVATADSLAAQRALAFGADQLLLQHRALFDLLAARAAARAAADL